MPALRSEGEISPRAVCQKHHAMFLNLPLELASIQSDGALGPVRFPPAAPVVRGRGRGLVRQLEAPRLRRPNRRWLLRHD